MTLWSSRFLLFSYFGDSSSYSPKNAFEHFKFIPQHLFICFICLILIYYLIYIKERHPTFIKAEYATLKKYSKTYCRLHWSEWNFQRISLLSLCVSPIICILSSRQSRLISALVVLLMCILYSIDYIDVKMAIFQFIWVAWQFQTLFRFPAVKKAALIQE